MTNHEPLVPLAEFGIQGMTPAELESWAELAGVTVAVDYLDRPAVSLPDAYSLGEQRRRAEQEWNETLARRHTEHRAAVADLQDRCNAAYEAARDEYIAQNRGKHFFGGGPEFAGESVNAGLNAARMVWAAAPDLVRQEVRVVETVENDTLNSYELGTSLPREVIEHYVQTAARKSWR
jgi:hypothetical protein